MKKERNYNIDFLRGIATLYIVLIHTAWWSGNSYLPEWFRNTILIIDVPVFIFISGISFNFVNSIMKNIKGIIIQWKKWLFFLVFYLLLLFVFFREQIVVKDILSWIVYVFPNSNNIPVVDGSMWFMKMYIKVSLISSIIICAVKYYAKNKTLEYLKLIFVIFLFIYIYTINDGNFLFFDGITSFYILIYLLGYLLFNYKIKDLKQLFIIEIILLIINTLLFIVSDIGINDIQNIKFIPSLPYLFFALISITLFWYLKDNLKIKKKNKINYIGQNAIMFYFAQGVSSSFIYYVYKIIPFTNPILIFIILLSVNIICSIIGGVFLTETYKFISNKMSNKKLKSIIYPTKIK